MSQYFWVTGLDRQGTPTTAGPYADARSAEEATQHLRNVQVHTLSTRQHDKARGILKERMQGRQEAQSRMSADEPVPESGQSGFARLQQLLSGRPKPQEHRDQDY